MASAITKIGTRHDLSLDQAGEGFPDDAVDAWSVAAWSVAAVEIGGNAGGCRVRMRVDVQRNHQIGVRLVGEMRPRVLLQLVSQHRPPGEISMDARRTEPAFDASGEIFDNSRFLETMTDVSAVRPTMARVDDHDLAGQSGTRLPQRFPRAKIVRPATGDDRREPGERLERAGSAGAVGRQSDIALELSQRLAGSRAEDAVDAADLEAQFREPALQAQDVITRLRIGDHVGQQSVTQPPAGLVQHSIGRGADDAIG